MSSTVQLMVPSPMIDNFIQPTQPSMPGSCINTFLQPPPQMTMRMSTDTYYQTGQPIMSTNTYYQTGQPIILSVSNNTYYPPTVNGTSSAYSDPNGMSYPVTGVTCHLSLARKGICPGGVYYNALTQANHSNLPNKPHKTSHASSQSPASTSAQASASLALGAPTATVL
eukprot:13152894-Ditylum_brightwellii.AAC.1